MKITSKVSQGRSEIGHPSADRTTGSSEKVNGGNGMCRGVRRHSLRRIWMIRDVLAEERYPNCSTLAASLEVSEKTVKRDLDYMRDMMELPIEYDAHRHGYFFSKPVTGFGGGPKLTEAELFAFLVAHKATAQYQGTPFYEPLQAAFEKLTQQLDSHERYSLQSMGSILSFRPFGAEDTDGEKFRLLSQGITQERVLSFDYRKPAQRETESRRVRPYHLTYSDNRWYLLGYCEERGAVRRFAVCRMSGVAVTNDHFQRPADFDPNKELRGSLTVMGGDGDYNVVVEFDAWATDIMRGRVWHSSQVVTELPGGGSQVRMRLCTLDEVERWVLSWGVHANVVAPQELRERIGRTAGEIVRRLMVEG